MNRRGKIHRKTIAKKVKEKKIIPHKLDTAVPYEELGIKGAYEYEK